MNPRQTHRTHLKTSPAFWYYTSLSIALLLSTRRPQAALLPTSNLNGALLVLRVLGIVTAVLAFLQGFFYYTIAVYTFVLVYLIRVWQRIGVRLASTAIFG
jgi:hypothetical protein